MVRQTRPRAARIHDVQGRPLFSNRIAELLIHEHLDDPHQLSGWVI